VLQNDGKILIGVNLGLGDGSYGINRLNPDGTLDTSFLNGAVRVNNPCQLSIALQSDGKIIIAGCFTTVDGTPCGRITRLNPNGSLDSSFSTGRTGADFDIIALALQGETAVVIGGAFSSVNQVPRRYLARLFLTNNRPPVAGSPFIKVIGDEVSEIPDRRFLIWCSDPDNDPLSLSAVTSPSAMGALVTLETNQVFYAPPPGFLGDDTFGYTITDGNGGFASGTASLLVEPRTLAAATMFQPITSPGALEINFTGFADLGYTVERAESLEGPWTPIGDVLTDGNGAASFTDLNPPSGSAFYRAVH